MNKIILILLFLTGIAFRIWLNRINPQPFVWDQLDYTDYAGKMKDYSLFARTDRTYGYPAMVAVIWDVARVNRLDDVRLVQTAVDTLTGFLVFYTALKLFKKKLPAYIALFIFIFNPWTAVYTGVLLSETLSIFVVAFIFFLFILFLEKSGIETALVLSLSLGYLPEVRPSFLLFSTGMMAIILLLVLGRARRSIFAGLIMILLFLTPFIYAIIGNLRYFREFSLTMVDNIMAREFYIGLYLAGQDLKVDFPPNVANAYGEFTEVPLNKEERKAMADKYLKKSFDEIRKDPMKFVRQRIYKTYNMWDKTVLYPYFDFKDGKIMGVLTVINRVLILLFLTGIFTFIKTFKNTDSYKFRFCLTAFGFFLYITLLHVFTVGEQRYTLPYYPLVFLFASYGLFSIPRILLKR